MARNVPLSGERDHHWRHGWRLASVVLLSLLVVVALVLEVWAHSPGWLRGPRGLIVDALHWARVHWLTSGALGVVVASFALWIQRRDERRRAERDQTERAAEQDRLEAAAQAERAQRDAQAQAKRAALLAEHCWVDPATSWLPKLSDVQDPVALGIHPATAVEDLHVAADLSPEAGALELPARVPVYVPRDLDAKLDAALAAGLARGGLVLVWRDSTAGKSRAAFQAMRRLPGNLWLLVPTARVRCAPCWTAGWSCGMWWCGSTTWNATLVPVGWT